MNADTIGVFVPIIALFIPIVAIISGAIIKVRRDRQLHETVRQLSAQGRDIPPELLQERNLEGGKRRTMSLEWTPKRQLRAAILNIGVALGLGGLLFLLTPQDKYWAIGLLPLCIGVSLLVLWRIESRSAADPRITQ